MRVIKSGYAPTIRNNTIRFSEYYQIMEIRSEKYHQKEPLLSDFDKPSEKISNYYHNVTKRSEKLRYDQDFSVGIYTSGTHIHRDESIRPAPLLYY